MPIDPHRLRAEPGPGAQDAAAALEIPALTRRLVAGEERAYREFYAAYATRLSRYLLVVTAGDDDAAREALQETLRRVVRHVRIFDDEAIFWSWLTVLARSARRDEGRKRRRYFAFLDRFRRYRLVHPEAAESDRGRRSLHAQLTHHLGRLAGADRALVELKYFEHRTVAEIATQLQTSTKAVDSRLARIRQKLKQAIVAEMKADAHE